MSCSTLISEKKLEKLNKKNISNFQLIKNIPGTDHFQQNAAYVRVFSNWNQFQHFFMFFYISILPLPRSLNIYLDPYCWNSLLYRITATVTHWQLLSYFMHFWENFNLCWYCYRLQIKIAKKLIIIFW